mmetsp:Transcript_11327/g.25355  ORF Transcript_11327/g.25355 Transcript_11327/m.25355 type:complete len:81 (+) Transcript_11327:1004-1246(+)
MPSINGGSTRTATDPACAESGNPEPSRGAPFVRGCGGGRATSPAVPQRSLVQSRALPSLERGLSANDLNIADPAKGSQKI